MDDVLLRALQDAAFKEESGTVTRAQLSMALEMIYDLQKCLNKKDAEIRDLQYKLAAAREKK